MASSLVDANLDASRFTHVVQEGPAYLGTVQYPRELPNVAEDPVIEYLRQDPEYDRLLSNMSGTIGTEPYDKDSILHNVDTTVFQSLFSGESIEDQASYTAKYLVPQDVKEAAFHHSHFGQGYINTYKSDMPPQGAAILRELIAPEVTEQTWFGIPPRGPHANFVPGAHQFRDPRYNVPQFDLVPTDPLQRYPKAPVAQFDTASYGEQVTDAPSLPMYAEF